MKISFGMNGRTKQHVLLMFGHGRQLRAKNDLVGVPRLIPGEGIVFLDRRLIIQATAKWIASTPLGTGIHPNKVLESDAILRTSRKKIYHKKSKQRNEFHSKEKP